MSATVDVTVLDSWIDRNAAYDAALRKVYTLLVASKGKVTKPVQDAYDALKVALAALPGDSAASSSSWPTSHAGASTKRSSRSRRPRVG